MRSTTESPGPVAGSSGRSAVRAEEWRDVRLFSRPKDLVNANRTLSHPRATHWYPFVTFWQLTLSAVEIASD